MTIADLDRAVLDAADQLERLAELHDNPGPQRMVEGKPVVRCTTRAEVRAAELALFAAVRARRATP